MNIVWQIVFLLLWLFRLALLLRIVFEFVQVFARAWRPAGTSAVAMEILYSTTDPPVKLFRRHDPDRPARRGRVRPQHYCFAGRHLHSDA